MTGSDFQNETNQQIEYGWLGMIVPDTSQQMMSQSFYVEILPVSRQCPHIQVNAQGCDNKP